MSSLRRTHTFGDVRRASRDEIYMSLSRSGFTLPGPVNASTMNDAIQAQAPPPSPNNSPMHVPMELDTEVFVVGAAVPAVAPPTKAEKKLRAYSSLPYVRPAAPIVSAMRKKDSKKKTRRVSFQTALETIGEENETPVQRAPPPVKREGSFAEMFKKMQISRR
ncbi:unnamed protein product [Peniophora sp. CBMAI 1063]|nr:unnamed protein product [Peniophora sp. CBMAI 1063]